MSRSAYFKSDGPMMEIKMWRPWRQCISPKCLMSHLYPNGPSTKCSRSVATVTYAYRIVGILRDDKQRRNRSHRKSNCKRSSLGKSRLELRTKSQSVYTQSTRNKFSCFLLPSFSFFSFELPLFFILRDTCLVTLQR